MTVYPAAFDPHPRPLEEHARLCIMADAPVCTLGQQDWKAGSIIRWEHELTIYGRVVREATWDDVLACRRAVGNPSTAEVYGKVWVVEAMD